MFTLAIFLLDHFQFSSNHGPNIPGSYTLLFSTASDFTVTTRHIVCSHFIFLDLFVIALCSSPAAYWTPADLGAHLVASHLRDLLSFHAK